MVVEPLGEILDMRATMVVDQSFTSSTTSKGNDQFEELVERCRKILDLSLLVGGTNDLAEASWKQLYDSEQVKGLLHEMREIVEKAHRAANRRRLARNVWRG